MVTGCGEPNSDQIPTLSIFNPNPEPEPAPEPKPEPVVVAEPPPAAAEQLVGLELEGLEVDPAAPLMAEEAPAAAAVEETVNEVVEELLEAEAPAAAASAAEHTHAPLAGRIDTFFIS